MQFLTKRNFLHTARTTQNKNLSALLACVGTLLLPTSVLAGDLTQYQAKYDVLRKGETHGKAVRELKKAADGNYVITYHSEIEWMIFIVFNKLIKSKEKMKFIVSWKNKILFGRW